MNRGSIGDKKLGYWAQKDLKHKPGKISLIYMEIAKTSPLGPGQGPRKAIGPMMTDSQIKMLLQARAAGYSKQQALVQGLPIVTAADIPADEPYGTGRKLVIVRAEPEVLDQLRGTCKKFRATQGRVFAGCCRALLR